MSKLFHDTFNKLFLSIFLLLCFNSAVLFTGEMLPANFMRKNCSKSNIYTSVVKASKFLLLEEKNVKKNTASTKSH